jgi:carbon-monoxide dehydrogenase medium subunit
VKPSPLQLERPSSLDEALALLAEHGDDAKLIAGGQSLVPLLNFRLAAPVVLVDLGAVPALAGIDVGEDAVRVGAMCSQRDLERHAAALAACPLLGLALPFVGHVATRNRGTVGGSIAHADAAAELPLLLQTLAGEVEVTGPSGARLVTSEEFFVSHLTSCLEADEIVTEVRFPSGGAGWGAGFAEVAPRHGDYAVCAVACALRVEGGVVVEARLGAGAVSDRPLGLPAAAGALAGSRCEPGALAAAADAARLAVDPSDGMHASAEYRRHLTGVLVSRAARRAYASAATT